MNDIIDELATYWRAGETVGLGTVIDTYGSAPKPVGASMFVTTDGTVVGSVSGGCVESAVYEAGQEAIWRNRSTVEKYGVSDDDAFAVGLTCGGEIEVFVEPISRATFPDLADVAADIAAEREVVVATVVEHPDEAIVGRRLVVRVRGVTGDLGSAERDRIVAQDAAGFLGSGGRTTLHYDPDGRRHGRGMRVFVSSFSARPRMLVFGAVDFASSMATVGRFLGYRVTVCDARPVFTTVARFPDADEVVVDWPHRYFDTEVTAGRIDDRTVIAVLTHDPKFDVPLLERVLRRPQLAYVGAMGSRRTHNDRTRRLREAGLTDREIGVLRSPIGLDIGSHTPAETAVSIAAEIVATRNGANGTPLMYGHGPIHSRPDASCSAGGPGPLPPRADWPMSR